MTSSPFLGSWAKDHPVTGDWDCNGADSIGLARPSASVTGTTQWWFDNQLGGGNGADYGGFDWGSGTLHQPLTSAFVSGACDRPNVYQSDSWLWFRMDGLPGASSSFGWAGAAPGFQFPLSLDWDTDTIDEYAYVY